MSLAEIFHNEGVEEGLKKGRAEGKIEGKAEGKAEAKAALANTTIRLITKYVAPLSEDMKNQIREQEMSTLEIILFRIDEWETAEDIKQHLR